MVSKDLMAYQTIGKIEWAINAYLDARVEALEALESIYQDLKTFNEFKEVKDEKWEEG